MKTVSIYVPTHNRPAFLKRALDSLVNQDLSGFQVLVCDDGSNSENKKKVREIIRDYKDKFSDLIFFDEPEAKGACHARNTMINAADGEFITGLDDDDEFTPDRLRCFIESDLIDNYAYLSAGKLVNDDKAVFKSIETKGEITLNKLLFTNIAGNQVFTRTEYLRSIGGFDVSFPSWQDYDMWVRLTKEFGAGYKIQECTYILNIGHELGRITNSQKVRDGYLHFIEKHKDIIGKRHHKALAVQDVINSGSPLATRFMIENFSVKTFYPLSKYWAKAYLPGFFVLVRSFLRSTG
ncbi:glycosyltransferase [Halomonas shantousis]